MNKNPSAIVIGAGIIGLSTARALAIRGYQVTVIERTQKATGASIRNFGMIWPIGQPDGALYERAMLSRRIWKDMCREAGIWFDKVGSLHVAYSTDEWNVLQELAQLYPHRNYLLLDAKETSASSEAIVTSGLIGSLYSPDEMIVDPRAAIQRLPSWLSERFGIKFIWGRTITDVSYPSVFSGNETWEADEIYICSGSDLETIYPDVFAAAPMIKCKLQMMRMAAQPGNWRIGPALCGGLSLAHYQSFKSATSLNQLLQRFKEDYSTYLDWGIHVMVSQNESGMLTIGDSHEYGNTPDPFDKQFINRLILDYLHGFARFKDETVIETWNGVYAKMTNGQTEWIAQPEQGVTIITGLGGAGMTLGPGLCEQVIQQKNLQPFRTAGL